MGQVYPESGVKGEADLLIISSSQLFFSLLIIDICVVCLGRTIIPL